MRREQFAERCRSGKPLKPEEFELEAVNVRALCEGSVFADRFTPDAWKKYIEFDICHSLPVIAGPASTTGNYIGYHPAVLAASHASLFHQQTNLHHLIQSYYKKGEVPHDHIVGCVVGTHYPAEPEGGWKIPEKASEAIPIHAAAVMWRVAAGVDEVLKELASVDQKWSVSIEVITERLSDLGIYIPSERRIVNLAEATDDLMAAISFDEEAGVLRLGKHASGEQLVLAYGASDRKVTFQGVGYTPNPAEPTARITGVRLSSLDLSEAARKLGGRLLEVFTSGTATLRKGDFNGIPASADDPVALIDFRGRRALLRRSTVAERLVAKKSSKKN